MSEQKNDWFEEESEHAVRVRRDATYKFWEKMQSDDDLRKICTSKSDLALASKAARQTLEDAGNFEKIPDDVEVRVFEFDRVPADKIVTIVLPAKSDPPLDYNLFSEREIWRCSWNLWVTKSTSGAKTPT